MDQTASKINPSPPAVLYDKRDGVGIISLLVLAVAIYARYPGQLAGHWRWIYVVTVVIALYFNVFVAVVQAFEKIPALRAIAPTQTEQPFKLTQLVVLALFGLLGIIAAIRFRLQLDWSEQ